MAESQTNFIKINKLSLEWILLFVPLQFFSDLHCMLGISHFILSVAAKAELSFLLFSREGLVMVGLQVFILYLLLILMSRESKIRQVKREVPNRY